jgi:hypothetical protein
MKSVEAAKDSKEYDEVFRQYLDICNQAIERNKNKFPYTEIWSANAMQAEDDMKVHAVVFDDRPKLSYMLRLTKDMKIEIAEKKEIPEEDAWPFTYQYLKRVVDNAQEYIDHPSKLEWGWLRTIFGTPI